MNAQVLPSLQKLLMGDAQLMLWECFEHEPSPSWDFRACYSSPRVSELDIRAQVLLAELALWHAIALDAVTDDCLPSWLLAVRPFPHLDYSLRELLEHAHHAAMAVFPLAGCNGQPSELARIYVLAHRLRQDSRRLLAFSENVATDCSLLVQPPSWSAAPLEGRSWQLAAEMAKIAIADRAMRVRLGSYWAVSGACDGKGDVLSVALGNKAELAARTTRYWLVPNDVWQEFAVAAAARNPAVAVYAASSLRDAVIYVRDHGVFEQHFEFPTSVSVLHQLVGGALPPALSVPLLIQPRELCLYYSPQTKPQADLLQAFFADQKHVALIVTTQEIPSNHLALSEVLLRNQFGQRDPATALVNITGGNRLMGQAAMLAAKAQGMKMIYRDINAEPDELEVIDFAQGPVDLPRNGKVHGNNCPQPQRVNWGYLYGSAPRQFTGPLPSLAELRSAVWR